MKIKFNHEGGAYINNQCLLEVEADTEEETAAFMFETGWLPFNGSWYQCRSSRLQLQDISSRRKKELSKISFSENGSASELIERSSRFGCFKEDWVLQYLSLPHYIFYMDDAAFGVVNFFEDQIFYTSLVWDKRKNEHSYGTLSYYHLINKFKDSHRFMYISEYYDDFMYKKSLPGFEYWDGNHWSDDNKKPQFSIIR